MELIIILLIAVEVVIVCLSFPYETVRLTNVLLQCLIRDGPELWDMLFGSKPHGHEKVLEIKDEASSSTVTRTA